MNIELKNKYMELDINRIGNHFVPFPAQIADMFTPLNPSVVFCTV